MKTLLFARYNSPRRIVTVCLFTPYNTLTYLLTYLLIYLLTYLLTYLLNYLLAYLLN